MTIAEKPITTDRTWTWKSGGATFHLSFSATIPRGVDISKPIDVTPPVVTPPVTSPPIIAPPTPAPAEMFTSPGDDVVAAARAATRETVIYMRPGSYGPLRFDGFRPPGKITLRPHLGPNMARVQQVLIQNASDITLDGLNIWDDMSTDKVKLGMGLVGQGTNERFHVLNCAFRGHPDVNYFAWTKDKWNAAGSAGENSSKDGSIKGCTVRGINFGLQAGGNVLMEGNDTRGFCGDAYRGYEGAKIRHNYCTDNFQTSPNHNDMFQSFVRNGVPCDGLEISDNTFVSWLGPSDHPLRAESITCQGIGLYDGFYDNLTIKGNLVVTDHWHGISVYGARNAQIADNLGLNIFGKDGNTGRPWIQLFPNKDGRPSDNVVMWNNRAFVIGSDPKNTSIVQSGNVILTPDEMQALMDAYAARIRQ